MNQYLFLFTIGPVQSFIAQARKTQDLYAGSRLLSALTLKAMDTVGKANVIFPNSEIKSLPNRFIAKVNLKEEELQGYGEKIEKAVRKEWRDIAKEIIENYKLNFKIAAKQIEQHLEIYWVFTPINDNYKEAFQEIEALLAAVKQSPPFGQYSETGERGRKCSVDGQRNVKFYRRALKQQDWGESHIQEDYLYSAENEIVDFEDTRNLALLQPGEGLSAVSLVKRGYREEKVKKEEFESTADIALLKTIHFWKNNSLDYKLYKDQFGKVHFNAQLLYEENLTDSYFKKQGLTSVLNRKTLAELQTIRRKVEDVAKEKNCCLTKYYAILIFDGDGMGELLSGKRLVDGQDLEAFHQAFSKQLGVFAKEAEEYLDSENRGRTVYAGGDDFLGFVNLESLFEVLGHFQKQFEVLVSTPMQSYLPDNKAITFSAGICVAHYKEPLNLVLSRAREMEQKAKNKDTKNAFAISVIKGSGEDHDTVWGLENDNIAKLKDLVHLLRDETFSNTFIKNFQREFAPILNLDKPVPAEMQNMFKTELMRLAERSCSLPSKEDRSKKAAKELCDSLWDGLFIYSNSSLGNFFEMLNICDFLHRTLNPIKTEKPSYA